MVPLSILDLCRVTPEGGAGGALRNARDLAAHAERWGFKRYWVAEHHNMIGVASAATAVAIGYIADGTSVIRVGSGGIMLPNHAPYVVAEQFGTLASLYPDRIDLGLGRAPGTDPPTLRALRRSPDAAEHFPQDVLELQAYLAPAAEGQAVVATPGAGTRTPLWILGSSAYGATLAAELGLPYSFASHFAPDMLLPALEIYRARFKPSRQLARPHVMVACNVICAPTDAEAQWLATTQRQSAVNLLRGRRALSSPPVDDMDALWTPAEKAQAMRLLARSMIGSPQTVRLELEAFVAETRADEVIMVTDVYDHAARLRSVEMTARVMEASEARMEASEARMEASEA